MSRTNHNILSSRANLRAHRQVQSQLSHLNQQTSQADLLLRRLELGILQERRPKLVKCFQTFQWKYCIDKHSPWWKKLFFHRVYLPFVRFSWDKMGIVLPEAILLPDANLPKGALLVKEWQGAFSERWMAEQESGKHPFGGYTEVAFNWSEQSATTEPRSVCPTSPVDKKRRIRVVPTEAAALEMLQETLVRTRPHAEAFKSVRT